MKRIFFCFILSFLAGSFTTSYAQTLEAYMEAADESFAKKDYYSALKYYEIANEIKEYEDPAIWYKYAESARLISAYTVADSAYQVVVEKKATEYPLAIYWLANMKQRLGKYQQAKSLYERFIEESPLAEDYYKTVAERGAKESIWALNMLENPKNVEVKHLDANINTPYSEFGPYYKGDTLYYSSYSFVEKNDEYNPQRIYSRMMTSIDGKPGELSTDGFNQKMKHSAHNAFNDDFTRVYYTICEYIGETAEVQCAIYYRQKDPTGNWGASIKLPDYINLEGYTNTEPAIGKNRETGQEYLFFASDRPGGQGEMDIWCAYVEPDGSVLNPVNLPNINTTQNEITPFFHTRTQKLYFSSDGHQGMGGYDIFKADGTGDAWYDIENIGYPINSSYNDIYFSLNTRGTEAHFSSNRLGGEFLEKEKEICCNDIYSVELDLVLDLLAFTFDNKTKEPLLNATVELFEIDSEGRRSILTKIQPNSNDFLFPLERGKIYEVVATREGYGPASTKIDLTGGEVGDVEQIEKNLYLDPIEIRLDAFTFDFDDEEPLFDATITLFELESSGETKLLESKKNEGGNDFSFPLEVGKDYIITTERTGYESLIDTIPISEMVFTESKTIEANLFLKRTNFDDFLPLLIYFDNDIPKRGASSTVANTEYTETVIPYLQRQDTYKEEYTLPMEGEEKFVQAERFDIFFNREVKLGYDRLLGFTNKLYNFVKRGNSIQIAFKGYTSPRASDSYNEKLSKRRIDSVIKYFRNHNGGIFIEYMNDGRLTIEQEAYGETKAPKGVSDKLTDERDSIYSILASAERRVEIVGVSVSRTNDETSITIDQKNINNKGK